MARASNPYYLKKIPVNFPLYADAPEIALSVLGSTLINGFIEKVPDTENTYITRKRPGLSAEPFADLSKPVYGIQGLFWWNAKNLVVAVCHGDIYTIDQTGAVTPLSGDALEVQGRVVFSPAKEDGTYLIMANGGNMVYTEDAATAVAITSSTTGAPTIVSHVAYMDGYIIANQVGTPQFYWSAINDMTKWDNTALTPQYATEESKPQNILALDAQFDEIRIIGSESIEYWYNNASSTIAGAPFAKYEGATTMRGTGSPYTFVFDNNTHWFLDRDRNLCRLQVRTPQVVSGAFSSVLQGIPQVDDAFILPVTCDGKHFLVCIFPSSARSVVYDVKNDMYVGEWSYWNETIGKFQPWSVSAYCFCPAWGFHLAGDRATGKIYKIGLSYPNDAGDMIRLLKRTGYVDHGHKRRKIAHKVRLTLERGIGIDGEQPADAAPEMMYRYRPRDDEDESWSDEETVSLGKTGQTQAVMELNNLGIYRVRQHEFSVTDDVPVTIIDAEEEGEILAT